jgi:prolyl-tRNA synthetase
MLASKLYCPTLREVPADAVVISHQYMLRAGMIRKISGGIYTYLPMAWRTLRKIETIIREEMDASGAQEILMPIMQPAEIWKETKRWDVYGPEMFRLKDRHNQEYCLAPTHEELVTTLIRNELRSYKQLPITLYQMQNKYRDEIRPRFGLMRSREFIMKDGYSFDMDDAGADKNYWLMYYTYCKIFNRCGLSYRPVQADNGAIGGSNSHEFMVLANSGEADVVHCLHCDFAANTEIALPPAISAKKEDLLELELRDTPNCSTIEELAETCHEPIEKTIKALAFDIDGKLVLVMVRGDHEVNEVKVQNILKGVSLEMASEDMIKAHGLVPGYMSPIGADDKVTVIIDETVMNMYNGIAGANQYGKHYWHVTPARDFKNVTIAAIRLITEQDVCPVCGKKIKIDRGIEVGQVFKLGTKYSEAFNATFLDENGKAKPFVMGCYGIGVTRTMAASIEQHNDENGIIWPVSIAPYHVVVVPVNMKDTALAEASRAIYEALQAAGMEVVLDDRTERAGVKFKDADLIGYPIRITVGKAVAERGEVEIKVRETGKVENCLITGVTNKIEELLASLQ